ncbi:MAG TPA: hypothetical protein ENI51_07575 [Candidatus Atribacteria bacterium]|nr:hypothetical protein [Candidatus Atribacteria bacterium]
MKKAIFVGIVIASFMMLENAFAQVRWINGYFTTSGQYRRGHFRDVSCDGYYYNNANYLGYND